MDPEKFPLEPFNSDVNCSDLRTEWEEWLRALLLILELKGPLSQHEKFVYMLARGGRDLQRIYFNLGQAEDEIIPSQTQVPFAAQETPEFDNAIKRLNKFFVGKRNERIELEVFRNIKQADEPFNRFMLKLRTQAKKCDFGMREEKEILHQITAGARDIKVRDKGLENVMKLDELANFALNREILAKQKAISNNEHEAASVSHIRHDRTGNKRPSAMSPECDRCGSREHTRESTGCFARKARCNECGKIGHFARKCSNKRRQPYSPYVWKQPRSTNNIREMDRSTARETRPTREVNAQHDNTQKNRLTRIQNTTFAILAKGRQQLP
ncbi:uncharacterized protein LOC133391050 isoform X3 [Anopheles gambiae]|uniref:uncharacterized protein LOC125908298 isoform X3 n=1 Tax=Anopheles coluzzii TaxID=1518534 RepID=UPI0020FF9265|nr:uncharacterized protein LOC125908298 isoform X3 [Anopheles coluzzii]XP_061497024.1 uncharacterized protein LOC133391050 isoform X3 [Anopheles gambiae]